MFASACQRGPRAADAATVRADSIRRDSVARAHQDSINRTLPGYVVDSILPIDEEVRRFKSKIAGSAVDTLLHASASREALVRRIVRDVARGDSTDLAAARRDSARVHRSRLSQLSLYTSTVSRVAGHRVDADRQPEQ